MNVCARTLRRAGARSVLALALTAPAPANPQPLADPTTIG
jgi:hypothetical protein